MTDVAASAARRLAAILESSDDAIISTDLSGVILTWNPAAERIYGYARGEVLGRSLQVLLPADRPEEFADILARVGRGERIGPYDTIRVTKSRERLDMTLTVGPISDERGRVVGVSAIAHDLTGRRRMEATLRASEARWRAVVDAAVDGVIIIDAQGRVEFGNAAAERLFGYTQAEIIGQSVDVLMPSPHRNEHDEYVRRYLTTGEKHIIGTVREVTGLHRDGHRFPMLLSVGEINVGEERKFAGIIHDLTKRIRAEQQLREQAALVKLGEMAAVLAHEVRNPLTAVSSAIQVIGDSLPPDSQEATIAKEVLRRIDALNELTNDLLLFARPPHPNVGIVDLVSLLTVTTELLATGQALGESRVAIKGEAPAMLGDAELLKIAFQNLLINAAQAMKGQGTIHVTISTSSSHVDVTVIDSGPGIPPEIRPRLFEPFFTTKARGTGLGLPMTKRLVEAHGGTIAFEWPDVGGTTAVVRLPLRTE